MPPKAGLKHPTFWTDVMSAACTIGNDLTPPSENAFKERSRLSKSGSALSPVLARLRTSNDVSVSLESSSLESRCSGVCRFRFCDGAFNRRFEDVRSGSFETDLLPDPCVFFGLSEGEARDDVPGVSDDALEGGAGRA